MEVDALKPKKSACCVYFTKCSSLLISVHPFLQDHPGLRGTPLAMLAAQCNKLSTKSPPPLADAAVGKGFHPWKKSPSQTAAAASNSQQSSSSPNPSAANNLTQSSQSPEASNNTQQQPQR